MSLLLPYHNFVLWNSLIFTESHVSWGQKASIKIISSNRPGESSTTKSRFPRAMPTWVLNISGDGESTSFLSNLLQCLNLFHSSFQNEILHIDLTFSHPHSFPHPHKHYRKAQKADTYVSLSHRLQRTETCLLCSTSFDSGVPITSSQHLPLIYSVLPKQANR